MLKIGITGGLGGGKSTAAKYFESKQYPVLYADPLAKEVMVSDDEVKRKVIRLIGEEAYHPDGSLHTSFIAGKIFSDTILRKRLERIIHPPVLTRVESFFLEQESKENTQAAFAEAALIFESGMHKMLDYVIAVLAPRDIRIERISARDGSTAEEILQRMAAQHPDDYYRTRADFVVENSGTIQELYEKLSFIERIFQKIQS